MTARERRAQRGKLEFRSTDAGAPLIFGYAAVFNRLSQNLGYFVEQIAPGAFTKTLLESDPAGLFNHEPDNLLGRKSANTLRLSEDGTGLAYEIDPPDTTVGRDVVTSLKRGDLTGSSFSFGIIDEEWGLSPEGFPMCTLTQIGPLYDVGPVTYPAYLDSSSGARSMALQHLATKRHLSVDELVDAAEAGKLPVIITGRKSDALEPADSHSRAHRVSARTVQAVTGLLGEVRQGKALSSANEQFLRDLLGKLADVDSTIDSGAVAIDDALDGLSQFLGVDNPDDPDDMPAADALQVPRSFTPEQARRQLLLAGSRWVPTAG